MLFALAHLENFRVKQPQADTAACGCFSFLAGILGFMDGDARSHALTQQSGEKGVVIGLSGDKVSLEGQPPKASKPVRQVQLHSGV